GTYNFNASFFPVVADIQTTASNYGNINMNYWNGSSWTPVTTVHSGSPQLLLLSATQSTAPFQSVSGSGNIYTAKLPSGNTAYTWTHGTNLDWTVAANWTPNRTSPAVTDSLLFNDGSTTTAINVP